jgi:hypothetical protein
MVPKSSCPRKNTSPSSEELLVEKELPLSVRILANEVWIALVAAVTRQASRRDSVQRLLF